MRRAMTWSSLVVLVALGTACTAVPTTAERKPVHLTLFVYPAAQVEGGCAVVTIPQYVYVKQNDDIVWDVSNQTCPGKPDVDIDPRVVEITEKTDKEKKGKVKGDLGVYKYKIKLDSGFVEDPRIEIW